MEGATILTAAEEGREKKAISPCAILRPRGGQNTSPIDERLDPARSLKPSALVSHVHTTKQAPTSPLLPPLPRLVSDHHDFACQGRCRLQVRPPPPGLLLMALPAFSGSASAPVSGHRDDRTAAQKEETSKVKHVSFSALPVVASPRLTCDCRCCLLAACRYGDRHECQHAARVPRQPPQVDRQPHAAAGPGDPDKHTRRYHPHASREVQGT